MTVQELIDVLNKIQDKSKPVYLHGLELVEELKEDIYSIDIY